MSKQLCWKCAKACNSNLCIWVKNLEEKPRGCVVDKRGYIVGCPQFICDGAEYKTNKMKAKELGISERNFYWLKARKKKGENENENIQIKL